MRKDGLIVVGCIIPAEIRLIMGFNISAAHLFVHMLLHLSLHQLVFRETRLIEALETAFYRFFVNTCIYVDIFTGGSFSKTFREGFIIDTNVYL